jgi:lipopolysaccharide biosynthesis protein
VISYRPREYGTFALSKAAAIFRGCVTEVDGVAQIFAKFRSDLIKGIRAVHDRLSWHAAALRSRTPRIRRRWIGERNLADARKVAVLVHYSRRGGFLRYFRYLVEQLDRCGFTVIIVSNSPKLDPDGITTLLPHCALVLHRRNVGYDFGAWRDGIMQIPDLAALDQLLITNDSVFGPLQDLNQILVRCDPDQADVWGITESYDTRFHLQSYFMLFNNPVLCSTKFQKFWNGMRYIENKRVVIFQYEIGLSQLLVKQGFRVRALHPYRQLVEAVLAHSISATASAGHPLRDGFLANLLQNVNAGNPLNPTHYFWEYLVTNLECPFIKRDLLEKNPVGIPFLGNWRNAIAGASNYPIEFIEEYLQEASRNRVF